MGAAFRSRSGVAVAAAALAITAVAPAGAQTPTGGTGTSSGSTSLVRLVLGTDQLVLRLLGEDSTTTNDPAAGAPRATERLTPLQVSSTALPALDALTTPGAETTSTSGETTTATPPVDLATLVAASPVPGALSGTIDSAALRSVVDATGATSAATAAARDVAALAGLVRLGEASASLGSTALVDNAAAARGLVLDRVELLDLTAVLELLGVSLGDLPIDVLVGLLDQLGLPLPGGIGSADELLTTVTGLLGGTSAVRAQVTVLQDQLAGLEDDLAAAAAGLAAANAQVTALNVQIAQLNVLLVACGGIPLVCDPLTAQVAALTAQLAAAQAEVVTLTALVASLNGQIDAVLAQIDGLLATISGLVAQLSGLLGAVQSTLEGAALLTVEDLVVDVTAKADDTLATSFAMVVASIGAVRIGNTSLGGLDALADLGQVTALADQVTAALGGVLGTIAPELGGVLDLDMLDKTSLVTQEGLGTRATVGITALRATITPPDVCAVLQGIFDTPETLADVLTGLGVAPPVLPGPVGDVLGTLESTVACQLVPPVGPGALLPPTAIDPGGVAAALTEPLRLEAVSVAGTAFYAARSGANTPTDTSVPGGLAATGGDATTAAAGVAMAVLALAGRQLIRRSRPTT